MNDLQDSWKADRKNDTAKKRVPYRRGMKVPHISGEERCKTAQYIETYRSKRKKKRPYSPGAGAY